MRDPDKNECWESDRGIQVNVRDIKDGRVVVELVGTTLGAFARQRARRARAMEGED